MIRRIGSLAALVVFAGMLATSPAAGQDTEASDAPATTVRIKARKVETGKVEFGLELDGDREWLPRARFFPYRTATVGRWLFASPYTMSDGTAVRIQARPLSDGRLEFGLQVDGAQSWLPRARFFPYDSAVVGRWLFASPYSVRPSSGVPQSSSQGSSPDAPRNLRVAAVICDVRSGLHSVRLEWEPPAGAGGTTSYEVTRLRAPNRTANLTITDPGADALVTGTSHVDADVRRNELYEWSVRPQNATADATASVQLIFKPSWAHSDNPWGSRQHDCDETVTAPAGTTEPGVPQNLRARHDRAGDQIVVTWSRPADDGGARITSYQVGRSRADASGPASWWTSGVRREPPSATFDLLGATAGAFRFWVRAINSAGIGPWTSVEFKL